MNKYIISYDNLTDVLYINKNDTIASSTILDEEYIAVRKSGNQICGITIDGYKNRHEDKSWKNIFITKYFPDFDFKELSF